MLKINIPIIAEGKYDKIKLKSVVDATVITTDGFGVFNHAEKRALIRRIGENGVIILSDSDGGGRLIRSHLRGMLGEIPVYDLYIPQIKGKERRKTAPSKAGFLGVEGVPADVLRDIFKKFAAAHPELCADGENGDNVDVAPNQTPALTNAKMYELGLTGRDNSTALRDELCKKLRLPAGMSAKAFLEAVNIISSADEITSLMSAEG